MDPELDRLYDMLDQADKAGEEEDARDIASMIAEHKAKAPAQPDAAQPDQPQPNLSTAPEEQPFVDKLLRGLDRLPNLVGAGNVSTGFTKADVDPLEARKRVLGGAVQAEYAAARGTLDALTGKVGDKAIAGIASQTTRRGEDVDTLIAEDAASKEALKKANPLSYGVGEAAGYATGAKALSGVGVKGVAKQGALLAAGHAAADERPQDIATDALLGAAGGKVVEVGFNRLVKPVVEAVAPRAERLIQQIFKPGSTKNAEFAIPEGQIQALANRMKIPPAEVQQRLQDYVAKTGGIPADILSVVDEKTAKALGKMAQAKPDAADVFREAEKDTLRDLPTRFETVTAGTDSEANITARLKEHTKQVMRGPGGLAEKEVVLPRQWINDNLPEDPSTLSKALLTKAKTMKAGPERQMVIDAAEKLGTNDPEVKLNINTIDVLRRRLSKAFKSDDGLEYDLSDAATALKEAASTQHPAYKTDYLDVFSGTMRGLEARRTAAKILSSQGDDVVRNIEGTLARAKNGDQWVKEGAADGVLAAIERTATKSPKAAVKLAEKLSEPAVLQRIERLTPPGTADRIRKVAETIRTETQNKSVAAASAKDEGPIPEALAGAMEAVAAVSGRAGPGFMLAMVRRGAATLQNATISNRSAKALAESVIKRDMAGAQKIINRLAKTERQRKVIADAINAWAAASGPGAVAEARQ